MEQTDRTERTQSAQIFDTKPLAGVWPDEDQAELEALRDAFQLAMNPGNAYERSLVEQIVTMEWEMHRYLRLRDGLLHAVVRGAVQAHLLAREWEPTDEDVLYDAADGLVGDDQETWEQSIKTLARIGLKPTEIVMRAYADHADEIQHFDNKIADLERRKRRLREDFDRLQKARLAHEDQIIDADTIE